MKSTVNSSKITWTIYQGSPHDDWTEVFCADGDGLVSIYKRRSEVYYSTCDFSDEIQGIYATLEEALKHGEALLLQHYPVVYEEALHWEDEPTTEELRLAMNHMHGHRDLS